MTPLFKFGSFISLGEKNNMYLLLTMYELHLYSLEFAVLFLKHIFLNRILICYNLLLFTFSCNFILMLILFVF